MGCHHLTTALLVLVLVLVLVLLVLCGAQTAQEGKPIVPVAATLLLRRMHGLATATTTRTGTSS
jgi:hypothetical protein